MVDVVGAKITDVCKGGKERGHYADIGWKGGSFGGEKGWRAIDRADKVDPTAILICREYCEYDADMLGLLLGEGPWLRSRSGLNCGMRASAAAFAEATSIILKAST